MSIKISLNRVKLIRQACVNAKMQNYVDDLLKTTGQALNFKEVFKWIVSPIISKDLGKPANLDGNFWMTVSFNDSEIDELKIVDKAAEELLRLTGGGYH